MELMLRELRKAKNMTQEDLAKAIGSSKRVVGAYERQDNGLPLDVACRIADVLDCTLDELAGHKVPTNTYTDTRQESLNRSFERLDDAGKDAAQAALMGMAAACAQELGSQGDAAATA